MGDLVWTRMQSLLALTLKVCHSMLSVWVTLCGLGCSHYLH